MARQERIIKEINCGNLTVVENSNYQWAVLDDNGRFVVPYGKYGWIGEFDSGLARVRTDEGYGTSKWGIINEDGEVVLPLEYDKIWNFCGAKKDTITLERNGRREEICMCDLNPSLLPEEEECYDGYDDYSDYDSYGSHYGDFAGTYAQDVAGYSDDAIYDAFDGDPDAYWNID